MPLGATPRPPPTMAVAEGSSGGVAVVVARGVGVVEEGEEGVVGEESADLVVGADGVWSSVRKTLFGDGFAPKYT